MCCMFGFLTTCGTNTSMLYRAQTVRFRTGVPSWKIICFPPCTTYYALSVLFLGHPVYYASFKKFCVKHTAILYCPNIFTVTPYWLLSENLTKLATPQILLKNCISSKIFTPPNTRKLLNLKGRNNVLMLDLSQNNGNIFSYADDM